LQSPATLSLTILGSESQKTKAGRNGSGPEERLPTRVVSAEALSYREAVFFADVISSLWVDPTIPVNVD
jgi:hypothetical protein